MEDPVAELAVHFQRGTRVPDADLVRLTSAARRAGRSWRAIATACGVRTYHDTAGVLCQPSGMIPSAGAGLLLRATRYARRKLTGALPLTWDCLGCGRQVSDRVASGRPVHIEHGHAQGCARLARDQTADDTDRGERLPLLVERSSPARGPLQRHRLSDPVIDDCPRCGWHGYFHEYVTVDGDWTAAICHDCAADLSPDVAVTVTFYAARAPGREPHAVIRRRARTDYPYPDIGQLMTWRLYWEHTTLLVEDERGSCHDDIAEVSRDNAEQIMARLAADHWPPEAARLPWVTRAYPQ
jgi:hypothetical protein